MRKMSYSEIMTMLEKDTYLQQIVITVKTLHPECKIYCGKLSPIQTLSVYPMGLTDKECEKIGQLIDGDYTRDITEYDPEFPFFIDTIFEDELDNVVEVTNLFD